MASFYDRLEEKVKVITGRKRQTSAMISGFSRKTNQNQHRASRASIQPSSVGKSTNQNQQLEFLKIKLGANKERLKTSQSKLGSCNWTGVSSVRKGSDFATTYFDENSVIEPDSDSDDFGSTAYYNNKALNQNNNI